MERQRRRKINIFTDIYYCMDCEKNDPELLSLVGRDMLHDEHVNVIKMLLCKRCDHVFTISEAAIHASHFVSVGM